MDVAARRLALLAAPLVGLLLAGCSGGGEAGGPAHEPAAATVVIDGFSYAPATVTVKQGDTVLFRNTHNQAHTATLDSGERNTGRLEPGGEARLTMPTMGRHAYHCQYHATMKGTIVVVEP